MTRDRPARASVGCGSAGARSGGLGRKLRLGLLGLDRVAGLLVDEVASGRPPQQPKIVRATLIDANSRARVPPNVSNVIPAPRRGARPLAAPPAVVPRRVVRVAPRRPNASARRPRMPTAKPQLPPDGQPRNRSPRDQLRRGLRAPQHPQGVPGGTRHRNPRRRRPRTRRATALRDGPSCGPLRAPMISSSRKAKVQGFDGLSSITSTKRPKRACL